MSHSFAVHLPRWVEKFLVDRPDCFPSAEDRMRLTIELSRENINRGTGGPFGAAVFDMDSGKRISVGVNCVVPENCSIAHAEIVAIALAQQALKTYDLSAKGHYELATSCAPCAMCLGAIGWSGIKSVLCGAGEADAIDVGFDEGAKPANWQQELEKRGIDITENLMQQKARGVLQDYMRAGGKIY